MGDAPQLLPEPRRGFDASQTQPTGSRDLQHTSPRSAGADGTSPHRTAREGTGLPSATADGAAPQRLAMTRMLLATCTALLVSACAYRPAPTETITIVDSPADVRVCTRLGTVSPTVQTGPGFEDSLEVMLQQTVALGGTHLYVSKRSHDWSEVRGIAYRCGPGVRTRGTTVVVRAKG